MLGGGVREQRAGGSSAEYDWTVGESPDGLRIDHGLLDKAHETVPPGRVQTVRDRGAAAVAAARLGAGGAGRGGLVERRAGAGRAARGRASRVIARVLPGVPGAGRGRADPPARAGRVVRAGVVEGVRPRGRPDTVFAARHGLLRRRLSLVPHAKVQSVRLTQGPWERFKGVADVQVDTGANKTVTARLRPAEEAVGLLLNAQAERSRTGRRTGPAGPLDVLRRPPGRE